MLKLSIVKIVKVFKSFAAFFSFVLASNSKFKIWQREQELVSGDELHMRVVIPFCHQPFEEAARTLKTVFSRFLETCEDGSRKLDKHKQFRQPGSDAIVLFFVAEYVFNIC